MHPGSLNSNAATNLIEKRVNEMASSLARLHVTVYQGPAGGK